jgi:hypothetical protein
MVLNPFLALFFLASIAVFRRIPPVPLIVSAALAFGLFFYFREYGILWYPDSSDDVPQYIVMYQSNASITVGGIVARFVEQPGGHEPLWHMLWWGLLNISHGSEKTFVFCHYVVLFAALFVSLCSYSSRYFILFALVYLFLTPTSIDALAHIWRQQLAFSIFLTGVGVYVAQGKRWGKWLIYASPFFHLALFFFVALFLAFEATRSRSTVTNRNRFLLNFAVIAIVVKIAATATIVFLGSIGLAKVVYYFIGSSGNTLRVYLLTAAYVFPMLAVHYRLRNDDTNNALILLSLGVFSIMFAFPSASGIYDRLLMFALPLAALYMIRAFMLNYPVQWCLPIISVVFVTGLVRVYVPSTHGVGVGHYLAYGHAFDPFMGVVKLLTKYGGA